MDTLHNIWTFQTKSLTIKVDAIPEYYSDLSWDETGEVQEQLESGELVEFTACATVTCRKTGEELASDYLGSCIYKDFDDFRDHMLCAKHTRELREQGSQASVGSYFADMVATVCNDAREAIIDRRNTYNNLYVRS